MDNSFTSLALQRQHGIYLDIARRHAMSNSAQKRAIDNYRSRLTERGIARFEIQALDADRDLLRSLARKLTEEGPEAGRLRRTIRRQWQANLRKRAVFSPHCVARLWLAPISTSAGREKRGVRSTCDALPP